MFTGAEALRQPFNRQVFPVRASYFDETERIVQHLTTLGIKKIAVFYQNDSYGKAGLEGVVRALSKRQLKAVAVGTVERNSVHVAQALESMRDVNFGGFSVSYNDKDHQGSNFTDLTIIGREGKFMH